jgi:UDP-2-acetamido-3-amino-2,3-dideoxy-glucuronate N-acetyltransferase
VLLSTIAIPSDCFIHDLAVCDSRQIGEGTRIWAFSHVLREAKIGSHCNLGEHVFIENRVTIGDHCTIKNGVAIWDLVTLEDGVFVGPYVVFINDLRPRAFLRRPDAFLPTLLKRGATIGANSTIVCGTNIGEYAFVGAGAVVVRDVPAHALVVGNPARIVGRVCYCGTRLDEHDFCADCELPLVANSQAETIRRHYRG